MYVLHKQHSSANDFTQKHSMQPAASSQKNLQKAWISTGTSDVRATNYYQDTFLSELSLSLKSRLRNSLRTQGGKDKSALYAVCEMYNAFDTMEMLPPAGAEQEN